MTDPFEAYERRIKELEEKNDRLTEQRDALTSRVAWLDELLAMIDQSAVRVALSPENRPQNPAPEPGLDTGNSIT